MEILWSIPMEYEVVEVLPNSILKLAGIKSGRRILYLRTQKYGLVPINFKKLRLRQLCLDPRCCVCGSLGTELILHRDHEGRFALKLYAVRDQELVEMTVDHWHPTSMGGRDRMSNLLTMCSDCNQLKADGIFHSVEELREILKHVSLRP